MGARADGGGPDGDRRGHETPRGVLVDTLMEQGFPRLRAQSETARSVSGSVYDEWGERRSAGCARAGRCAAHGSAGVSRGAARRSAIMQLRELCRIVEELQDRGRALGQSLARATVSRGRARGSRSVPRRMTLAVDLLATTPHPDAWPQLPRRRIASALRAHRIRRLTADARRAPPCGSRRLHGAPGVAEAVALRIASLVPQLLLVHAQRTAAERDIERALDALAAAAPDGRGARAS